MTSSVDSKPAHSPETVAALLDMQVDGATWRDGVTRLFCITICLFAAHGRPEFTRHHDAIRLAHAEMVMLMEALEEAQAGAPMSQPIQVQLQHDFTLTVGDVLHRIRPILRHLGTVLADIGEPGIRAAQACAAAHAREDISEVAATLEDDALQELAALPEKLAEAYQPPSGTP